MNILHQHTEHSSYREKLIEHLFISELLKISWLRREYSLEISKPEVDRAGYDIVAENRDVIRHIQLKASYVGGKTSRQKVHIKLGEKPAGCVVWIYFDHATLQLGPFFFFGGSPKERLPDLSEARVGRHTKGNRDGFKAERPNIREVNKGDFSCYESIDELYDVLFGTSFIVPGEVDEIKAED